MSSAAWTTQEAVGSDLEIVHASMRQYGKSFSFASMALPSALRNDTAAVYAYCRRADDAIDTVTPTEAKSSIERLEAELEEIYAGVAQDDPVLAAFADVVKRRNVPRHYPSELLAGMRMDVELTKYESLDDLLCYCYRVAGTVGLMMCHVFGALGSHAMRAAAQLGMAMQLTNVCRDVYEDWQRGRCYLPAFMLQQSVAVDVSGASTFPTEAVAPFSMATRSLLAVANELYVKGEEGIRYLPFRSALAVRTARFLYADIGRIVAERGGDPRLPRAVVPLRTKLLLASKAIIRTLLEPRQTSVRITSPALIKVNDVLRI